MSAPAHEIPENATNPVLHRPCRRAALRPFRPPARSSQSAYRLIGAYTRGTGTTTGPHIKGRNV